MENALKRINPPAGADLENIYTGGRRLVPVLNYVDVVAAHDYLVEKFGFTSGGLFGDAPGSRAEVHMNEEPIWLHSEAEQYGLVSPTRQAGSQGGVTVIVDDVDALYQRCKDAGVNIDIELRQDSYGIRLFGARDLEDHAWYFGSLTHG